MTALALRAAGIVLGLGVATVGLGAAQEDTSESTPNEEELSLEEIDQQLNNPLTSLWSLTFQENYSLLDGDRFEDDQYANTFFFQPALPIPFGSKKKRIFIGRPVFPLVTSPYTVMDGSVQHTTGFGDMQLFTAIGPDRTSGSVIGVGATFIFPTASSDVLGAGKYQLGPSFLFFLLGDKWTVGTLTQHWWSVAGDDKRSDTNRTDIQYVARHRLPNAWSIGLGPTISIDWEADSDNRVTFPIGLGVTKTVRLGKMPVKMRLEPQYSLIRPDDLGKKWNVRLQITPVIPSPF